MRIRATCVVLALAALLVVGTRGPAEAHAVLVGATPADGSTVTTAPSRVSLRFDDDIRTPATIVVTGPSGRVDHGSTGVLGSTVEVAVRMPARSAYVGDYSVAYRVVSADGHPVTGETTFDFRPHGVTAGKRGDAAPAPHHTTSLLVPIVAGVAVLAALGLLLLPRRRRADS